MKEKAIIVGAGTYGEVYAEYLKLDFDVVGFVDDNLSLIGQFVNGIKVLGNLNWLLENEDRSTKIFIPIGNTRIKKKMLEKVRQSGFSTPNFIHSSVNIDPSVKLGDNAIYILQGSVVMPLATIENDVMISSSTTISHHTIVEEGVFISFGVKIGASLRVKSCAYIGIGAIIMTGVKEVGIDSLIGAGAVVIKDVPDYAVVVGNPAKIIKYKE